MQIISRNLLKSYNKYFRKKTEKTNCTNNKILTRGIIESLKQAEREINTGKVISSETVFEILREKYDC